MKQEEFQKQVIVNLIKFFHKNTKHCHLLKMMKLLYLVDLKALRETGDVITGFEYFKWERGPVPVTFYNDLKKNNLWDSYGIKLRKVLFNQNTDEESSFSYDFIFKNPNINLDYFSKNQQRIMKEIAEIYKDVKSADISEITHKRRSVEGYPWFSTELKQKIDFFKFLGENINEKDRIKFEEIFQFNQLTRKKG